MLEHVMHAHFSRRRWRMIHHIFALCATVFAMSSAARAADLLGVRFGERSPQETRIVVDLDGAAAYQLFGDDEGGVLLELSGVRAAHSPKRKAGGLVTDYAVTALGVETRINFNLSSSVALKKAFLIPPSGEVKKHRLVIDIRRSDQFAHNRDFPRKFNNLKDVIIASTEESAPATKSPPAVQPVVAPTKASAAVEFPTIFIDAGHGGGDPGAIGPGGTKEKAVTLAAAKKLAEILKAKGRYQIIMTRVGDARFSLEQRNKLARKAAPDLFISIHADAHNDPKLRGGSVYTLSAKGIERSAREAKSQKNVRVGDLDMDEVAPELGEILYDFAQRETVSASARFADVLVDELKGVTPLLNNTHRRENFFLLLAPDVPAVLLELAYLSNKDDEKNLKSAAWREKTMDAVAEAIDRYFNDQSRQRSAVSTGSGARDSG